MTTDHASHVSCETPSKDQGPSFNIPKPIDLYDIARFFSNVAVKRLDECWYYHGTVTSNGYGQFVAIGIRWTAHRFSYTLACGHVPPDLVIRHKCDNKRCVNPFHLETGTNADNVRDRDIRQRTARGTKNGSAKLSEEEVLMIVHDGDSYVAIAKKYGVHPDTIGRIKSGEGWNHVTRITRKKPLAQSP